MHDEANQSTLLGAPQCNMFTPHCQQPRRHTMTAEEKKMSELVLSNQESINYMINYKKENDQAREQAFDDDDLGKRRTDSESRGDKRHCQSPMSDHEDLEKDPSYPSSGYYGYNYD